MAAGRPTKYKPEYCQQAIDYMADGYSVTAFAGHIQVARSTVFKWAEDNPEFSDALKTAQAMAAMWWEDTLRNVAKTGDGNASAAIFGVKNRSNEDWKDKQGHELSGPNGEPIKTESKVEWVIQPVKPIGDDETDA